MLRRRNRAKADYRTLARAGPRSSVATFIRTGCGTGRARTVLQTLTATRAMSTAVTSDSAVNLTKDAGFLLNVYVRISIHID